MKYKILLAYEKQIEELQEENERLRKIQDAAEIFCCMGNKVTNALLVQNLHGTEKRFRDLCKILDTTASEEEQG